MQASEILMLTDPHMSNKKSFDQIMGDPMSELESLTIYRSEADEKESEEIERAKERIKELERWIEERKKRNVPT